MSVNTDKLQVLSIERFKPLLCFCYFCCLFKHLKGSNWLHFLPRIFHKHYPSFRFAGRTIVEVNIYPSDRRINKIYFERHRFLRIKAILSHCIKMMTVHLHSLAMRMIYPCCCLFRGVGLCLRKEKKRLNRILSILIRMTGRSHIFLLEKATVAQKIKIKNLHIFKSS